MPDLSPREEKIEVRQCDREAAYAWFTLTNSLGIDHTGKAFEDALWDGSYDGDRHPLVQAFARHRQAAEAAAIERAAKVAEEHGINVSNEPTGRACSRNIADAIRRLGATVQRCGNG